MRISMRGPAMLCAAAAAAVVLCSTVAFAQAAAGPASPAPDFNVGSFLQLILPGIADTVVTGVGLLGAWLAVELKAKWGVDVEAQERAIEASHRDALHSAVSTGLWSTIHDLGLDKVDFTPGSPFARLVVEAVNASVPEAVAALGAGEKWILKAAAAHLALDGGAPPPAVTAAPAVN